jgi:hypothetical protein
MSMPTRLSRSTSENSGKANFLELAFHALGRIENQRTYEKLIFTEVASPLSFSSRTLPCGVVEDSHHNKH